MPLTDDRVKETTIVTGTGTLTLLGAQSQFFAFSDVFNVGAMVQYAIVGQTGTEFEIVEGQLVTSTTLSRLRVRRSSNSGNLVVFSAGTKDVFATFNGRSAAAARGRAYAMQRGWAMP